MSPKAIPARGEPGFTLVELLVSMVIIVLILLLLVSITNSTTRTWSAANGKIEAFREAREAFEAISRRLSQATLNTYWGYKYPNGSNGSPDTSQAPTAYVRQSELRFLADQGPALLGTPNSPSHAVFFQAPLGVVYDQKYANLENLLNTWGFFIEFGDDSTLRPPFLDAVNPPIAKRWRFRAMELMEPSDSLTLYNFTSGQPDYFGHDWFTIPLTPPTPPKTRPVRPLAENIVALVIRPCLTPQEDPTGSKLAPLYAYDSTNRSTDPASDPKNQLPPVVQVTMVAVDETSFNRLQGNSTAMPDFGLSNLFQKVGDMSVTSTSIYAQDLLTFQQTLQNRKLVYRTFTTSVSLRAAKWSRKQTN